MSAEVHLRSVRPARRIDPRLPFAPKSDRRREVRALCGQWVGQAEAVRADRTYGGVICTECCARQEARS